MLYGQGQVFRHYKGGRYLLLTVADTHDHNGCRDAVYVSLTTGAIVTRPYMRDARNADSWTDVVTWPDGDKRPRFVEERMLSLDTIQRCGETWWKNGAR